MSSEDKDSIIKEKELQINTLNEQLLKMSQMVIEFTQKSQELSDAKSKIQKLESDATTHSDAEKEAKGLNQKLSRLEKELDDKTLKVQNLEKDIKVARQSEIDIQIKFNDVSKKLQVTEKQMITVQKELEQLQDVRDQFQEKLKIEKDRLERNCNLQREMLTKQQRDVAVVQFDLEKAQKELNKDLKSRDEKIAQLQKQVQEISQQHNSSQNKVDTSDFTDMEKRYKAKEDDFNKQLKKLSEKNDHLRTENDRTCLSQKQCDNQIGALENQVALLTKQLDRQKMEHNSKDTDQTELNDKVESAKTQMIVAYAIAAMCALGAIYAFIYKK